MRPGTARQRAWRPAAAAIVAVTALSGCGGSGTPGAGSAGGASRHGTVRVLYAGSLVNLMEHAVAGGFGTATGYRMRGEAKGSKALAHEIRSGTTRADVFVSADPAPDDALTGRANGDWVSWYATFATAPLVLGYNPRSGFADDLRHQRWQRVVARHGFRLGRTDPTLDPKGKLAASALEKVGLSRLAHGDEGVFPEETLLGRLQSGQLDAAFFYSSEATEQHIPTVPLTPVSLGAHYTVTVLNRAPDRAGAIAFVRYLLGTHGRRMLHQHGLTVADPPTVSGDAGAVPDALAGTLRGG